MPGYSMQMLLIDVIKVLVLLVMLMAAVAYTTFAERRFAAFFQGRIGPNRAGPLGLLQPLADGIKFLFKEHFVPRFTDRFLYRVAPVISFIPALILVGVIPFGPDLELGGTTIRLQIADPNFVPEFLREVRDPECLRAGFDDHTRVALALEKHPQPSGSNFLLGDDCSPRVPDTNLGFPGAEVDG